MKNRLHLILLVLCLMLTLFLMASCGTVDTAPENTAQASQTTHPGDNGDGSLPQETEPDQNAGSEDLPDVTDPTHPPSDNTTEPEQPTPTEPVQPTPTEPEQPTDPDENASCTTHNYTPWTTVQNATCTETGLQIKSCKKCGDKVEQTIPVAGHNEETVAGYSETCTDNGLTDGIQCTVCKVWIKEQTVILAKGHTKQTLPAKEPTCSQTGLTAGEKCGVCHTILTEQKTIAKKQHTEVTVPGREATCAQTGLTEGKQCSVCKTFTVPQQTVPKLAHSFGEWRVISTPSCSTQGVNRRTCEKCFATEDDYIPATGVHDYSNGGVCSCGDEVKGSSFLTYRLSSDGTYYICTGTSTSTLKNEIIIPSYYNGKPVKEVGTGNCTFCDTKKITIMEGIERINDSAFYLTSSLKEVYLPRSLKYIGTSAFGYCDNLEAVYVESTGWKMYSFTGKYEKSVSFSSPYQAAEYLRDYYRKSYAR